MKTFILILPLLICGCNGSPNPQSSIPKDSGDPKIKSEINYNGPAGSGYQHKYEGPASQAPDWAKPKPNSK